LAIRPAEKFTGFPRELAMTRVGDTSVTEGASMVEPVRGHDFDLLERYQGVSAEFVRLALLGIGAVGLLYTLEPGKQPTGLSATAPKVSFSIALFALGLSAAFGISHRYFSTDSMACQIAADRQAAKEPPDKAKVAAEFAARDQAFAASRWTLLGSAIALVVGSLALGVGFFCVLVANQPQ
jgi:hypothetical protein